MSLRKVIYSIFATSLIFSCSELFAYTFFTGNAGVQATYEAIDNGGKYDPNLSMEAYFEGQFNFSNNLWSHLNISLATEDFLTDTLFQDTDAKFNINELSLVHRQTFTPLTNFASVYLGSYDTIGSDIFLIRYLGSKPIASKLMTTWLGSGKNRLYEQTGIGFTDIFRINSQPLAIGINMFFNQDLGYFKYDSDPSNDTEKNYFNTDLRLAGLYKYFTFDVSGGIGFPGNGIDSSLGYIQIKSIFVHAGATLLFGNTFTNSLFIQAGVKNAKFDLNGGFKAHKDQFFLLAESRLIIETARLNFTFYSVPKACTESLTYLEDTLGFDINVYGDNVEVGGKTFTIGTHLNVSFPDKYAYDIIDTGFTSIASSINDVNLFINPYISTVFLTGELDIDASFNVLGFWKSKWYENMNLSFGYKLQM